MMIVPPAEPLAVKPSGCAPPPGARRRGRTPDRRPSARRRRACRPRPPRRRPTWRRRTPSGVEAERPDEAPPDAAPTMPSTRESATTAFFHVAMGERSSAVPAPPSLLVSSVMFDPRGRRGSTSLPVIGSPSLRVPCRGAPGGIHGPGYDAMGGSRRNAACARPAAMSASPPRLLLVEDDLDLRKDLLDALGGASPRWRSTSPWRRTHCTAITTSSSWSPVSPMATASSSAGGCGPRAGRSRSCSSGRRARRRTSSRASKQGADDYMTKPPHIPELARVRTLLRRTGKSPSGGFVKHLDLWVDLDRVEAGRGEERG